MDWLRSEEKSVKLKTEPHEHERRGNKEKRTRRKKGHKTETGDERKGHSGRNNTK